MVDHASSPTSTPVPTMQQKPETADADVRVKEEESLTLPSPTISVVQTETNPEASSFSPRRSFKRTEAQRRALLRDDPHAQEAEPHRVLCRNCQRWIKLSATTNYALANWEVHRQRCRGSPSAPWSVRRTPSKPNFSPSSRVATAERKIVLLNDPQVRASSPGHVCCGTCKSIVALEGEVDYDLTKWTEHKGKCVPMTPAPITPQASTSHRRPPPSTSSTHSQVSVGRSPRSPTPVGENSSNNLTETTAVTESSPAEVKLGVKRRSREEETEDEENVDERPTNRARTETYRPDPEKEAPSLLGLFMQPLKEFARGFQEGLGST